MLFVRWSDLEVGFIFFGGLNTKHCIVKVEQYNMVKEALHERANLLEIAPHLSFPLPIMLPVYKWWQLPYFWAGIKVNLPTPICGHPPLKQSVKKSKQRSERPCKIKRLLELDNVSFLPYCEIRLAH